MTDKTVKKICSKCGTRLTKCVQCGDWFNATNATHIYCLPRCRMRRFKEIHPEKYQK